jgi:hypothetical protein
MRVHLRGELFDGHAARGKAGKKAEKEEARLPSLASLASSASLDHHLSGLREGRVLDWLVPPPDISKSESCAWIELPSRCFSPHSSSLSFPSSA